jgi:hypothetical protein
MRYMVVWIQNHDKLIVLIWKTLDMRFGCKIRINLLHSVQLSCTLTITPPMRFAVYEDIHPSLIVLVTVYNCPNTEKCRVNKIHIGRGEAEPDMNFIDPIFSVLG